tara:strand:- start:76 stop:468 length:393 start_codon:yes stop_codon:yes gene_type:complete
MELDKNDFVLYKENNRIKSGGYSVNSILLNKNNPAFTTYNKQSGGGAGSKKVSEVFSDLAVPAGLLYMKLNTNTNSFKINSTSEKEVLSDSIHDQLLELLQPKEKQKYNIKSRKQKKRKKVMKKTRRVID